MIGKVEELDNGVVVYQATEEPEDAHNIYCEACYCSRDSSCFVYARSLRQGKGVAHEYVACDFGTWEKRVLAPHQEQPLNTGKFRPGMRRDGRFYYLRPAAGDAGELVHIDPLSGQSSRTRLPDAPQRYVCAVVSPDDRYLAYNMAVSYAPQMFAIEMLDLQTGEVRRLQEDPYICNTHHQFEPRDGKWLVVQHNRGCEFSPEGKLVKLAGDEGATLFFIEVDSGFVSRPKIAPPYTDGISGHETWIGTSGELILTLNVQADYDRGKGAILGVRPAGDIREICAPHQANHIGMDPDGRLFVTDSYSPDEIVIGSPHTNKIASVCPARIAYERAYDRPKTYLADHHPHPYISPDLKWVIFNSDRAGVQQVYAARLPDEMVADVTEHV